MIVIHGRGREHVGAFDVAGGNFQIPVATDPGAVAGSGDITTGQLRQRVDETQAALTFGGVAAVDHDVAADVHVLADFRQHGAAGRDVIGRQITVTQPQIACVAVGDDLHRTDALMGIEVVGNLLQAVLARVQLNHLSARRDAFKQAVGVLDPRIDEHHALSRYRDRRRGWRGIGLAVGILAGDRLIGGRCLDRVGRGMGVSLGSIGHRGGYRAVEQHAGLQ